MKTFSVDSKGFSMIEVLVTVVLICIGVLGMVAMQARTISYTQDSVQRNTAAMLADDLLEIIRADSSNVASYYKAAGESFPQSCPDTPTSSSDRLGCWAKSVLAAWPENAEIMSSGFYISKTDAGIEVQLAWPVKSGECLQASNEKQEDDDSDTLCHYKISTRI